MRKVSFTIEVPRNGDLSWYDMLRVDRAWPATTFDAGIMAGLASSPQTTDIERLEQPCRPDVAQIRLQSHAPRAPNIARWESYNIRILFVVET